MNCLLTRFSGSGRPYFNLKLSLETSFDQKDHQYNHRLILSSEIMLFVKIKSIMTFVPRPSPQ
jgi:hypothetical protein